MSALPVEAGDGPGAAEVAADVVALHPERTADPATIRWVVAGRMPARCAAATVEALAPAGVLAGVAVEGGDVLTTLAPGRAWRAEAAGVRAAISGAVSAARAAERGAGDTDAALLAEARRVVADDVNPYAAGHGGALEVLAAHDGTLEVALTGACHGCPAAAFTVQGRLGRRLADAPGYRGVRVAQR